MTKPANAAPAIEVRGVTKKYGDQLAVDDMSFTVQPGRVTGFLGPNGAGKSTTMRLILGLDRPDRGTATIGGRQYRDIDEPLRAVGALLEAKAVHKGRTARAHLLALAQTQGLPQRRVAEVIHTVGLAKAARRRTGGFSLGMGQRLGIAAALLGDPEVLIFDEPLNGLDPEGIVWIRTLIKERAAQGCTVLVSSHLMNEMAVTADHLVVIAHGRLVADCPVDQLIDGAASQAVTVVSPDVVALAAVLVGDGGEITADDDRTLTVTGLPAPRIAELASANGIVLHELTTRRASLEDAFIRLTQTPAEGAVL